MDLLSCCPFWPIRDGLPATYFPLEENVHCEVAVIGAGITGALVAWHLAEAGIDTVVLDRRDVAHGSTAGSTGLLQYELDEPLHRLAARFGSDFAIRSYRRCRAAIDGLERLTKKLRIECGFVRKSSLLLASERSHLPGLRREFDARRAAGFAVEWWSRCRLAAESTLPHPAAIRSRDGAHVDPYRLTYGLLAAAESRGTRIFDRTAVTQRKVTRRGVVLHTDRGRSVRARCVVLANGYEGDALLPEKVTALHSTFALMSEPVTSFAGWPDDGCLIWETKRPYTYLCTTPEGRCIIGGYDEPFRDPVARDRLLGAKTRALGRRFRQLFPRIPLEVASSWAGTFATTEGGLPFIDRHPRLPRAWLALGYGGNGITFSLVAAEIIRAAILGRTDPDAELFGFDRRPGKPK